MDPHSQEIPLKTPAIIHNHLASPKYLHVMYFGLFQRRMTAPLEMVRERLLKVKDRRSTS